MKRAVLAMSLVLGAAAALVSLAGAHPRGAVSLTAAPKKQKVLVGFYRNRTVNYFDYGRIKLRPGNKLAPIWASQTALTASARSWTARPAISSTPRCTK